jgi:CheY-like chemotaxis protein
MDKQTLARAFEPFFSTKRAGRGTGLGLATVDGIIQQSGGAVQAISEIGRGTTFTVLLPRKTEAAPAVAAPPPPATSTRTGSRDISASLRARSEGAAPKLIFVAEDDPSVLRLITQILENAGITVVSAGSGDAALALRDRLAAKIDLLVTDIVMPGTTGPQVARGFRAVRSDLPVLFMSGYADEVIAHDGMRATEGAFIEKPFTPAAFLTKVRALLAPTVAPVSGTEAPHDTVD